MKTGSILKWNHQPKFNVSSNLGVRYTKGKRQSLQDVLSSSVFKLFTFSKRHLQDVEKQSGTDVFLAYNSVFNTFRGIKDFLKPF